MLIFFLETIWNHQLKTKILTFGFLLEKLITFQYTVFVHL